jgi:hypothetical protein
LGIALNIGVVARQRFFGWAATGVMGVAVAFMLATS